MVNGYLLTFAGFMLLGGRAADLFGRRRILTAGLVLFSAASLVAGVAALPGVLVAARVAQGVGAALLAPATLAVINTSFTEGRRRARAFGAWSAAGGVGGMAGAVAGGALTTGLSWRWVFLINVPIGAAAMRALPGTRTARRESLDIAGAVTGTAGLAALIYGIMHSTDHGWTSATVVGPVVAGLLLLAVFLVVEARSATRPMLPLRLLRLRGVAVGSGYLTGILGPTLFIATGIGLTFPTLMAATTADVPGRDAGTIGGLAQTASQAGGSLGLAVLATAATRTSAGDSSPAALAAGYDRVFLIAAGLGLAIAAACLLLPRHRPDSESR
ncbi:MFS transporter [Dactylosporangium sp. NPDC049742]|uniref:MFS transporter n=1 Tax=Dactylosporangium sp. NPDC049742 TaxID=3154737 RepID=UPI003438AD93